MAISTRPLHPVIERGWPRGFRNLLRKENSLRWGGLRWLRPALVWVVILNGFILLVAYTEADGGGSTATESALAANAAFMTIGSIATAIGVVVGAQGAVIGEKQLGTAAWVLSKPASRSAFILAKLVSHALGLVGLAVILPSLVFFAQSQLLWGQMPVVDLFLRGGAEVVLHLLFYLALVLMLGTLFNSRGPVAAIGLGFLFAGRILHSFLPDGLLTLTPWKLSGLAPITALGGPLPAGWQIPVVATALWTVLFLGVALWRFGREEF